MAKEIIMPKFGFTQEESTIVAWLKEEGEPVEKGEPLCEVSTDKVNMEVEAPGAGILGGIRYREGETVNVTEIIAYLLAEGESAPAGPPKVETARADSPAPGKARKATPVARRVADTAGVRLEQVQGSGNRGKVLRRDVEAYLAAAERPENGRIRATPAARRVAREQGLDLAALSGSGPRGRIQEADALAAVESAAPAEPAVPGAEVIPLEGMRATIARRMQASYQEAPHITFSLDVDMTEALAFREQANRRLAAEDVRISLTALLVRACAWALRQHPLLNSHLREEAIHLMPQVNIGVAVALDEGLIVPVVHNADRIGIKTIATEIAGLSNRARAGRLKAGDVDGGTFTISNLGMYGIDRFTAIINPPEVAILACGRVARRFVPDDAGQPVARPLLTLTLAVDHRVVDGALAARFLATLREALEAPATMLL